MTTPEWGPVPDALDAGIIVLDENLVVVGWNEWIARAAGYAPASALGRPLSALFLNLAETRIPQAIKEALQFGSSSLLTHSLNKLLPLQSESGQTLLQRVVIRPIPSGGKTYCLVQIYDVTGAITREKVLRERQNARYHAIVDSAPDAIITTSIDQVVQWSNSAAENVFGYSPAELMGQKLDLLLQDAKQRDLLSPASAGTGGPPTSAPITGRRKNGDIGHFEVSSAQWKADNRIFVTTIWRDVTERVVAENALKDSEARHRALAEALPQLVWICNGAGLCDYTNPQWQTYTGALPERSAGDGWLDFIHEEGRAKASSAWQTALETGTVFDADVRLRRKDQHYRWFKMRSIPVRGEFGNVSKWFGTATDITTLVEAANALKRNNEELEMLVTSRTFEREAALRQLHESQKMETIGQLTGGVAHDFNNLLAVILGSLSLLKKALPDDPRTSRLLEGAIQGAERGANLTKRLLAFARRQELKLSAVEVQKLIPDMQDFLRQSIGPIIKIILDIPSDVPPVKIDANQLELALMNLAVNARDAMSDGGTLTITCNLESTDNPLLPSTLAPGEYVRISVADTGQGMSEATLAKAMEPFFTTKGIGKGTGLGLSMVHGLTAQCGGAMQITSKPGRGTTVSLWLPRASREELLLQSLLEAPSAPEIKGRQLKILLVDDDALVSKNTTYMLHDLGHSVKEASSGSQALQLVRSGESFDLVLTDYAMPEMNGLDLAKEIKQLNPQLPVVIATGFADLQPLTTLSFPRLGKPYTQDQLAAFLESAVGPAAG